jgi:hypothetical protein
VSPLAAQEPADRGAAATTAAPSPQSPADPASNLTLDLERIREGLARSVDYRWTLPKDLPVFRLDIREKLPGIEALIGELEQLRRGPFVASPYHQEFLDLVTPPEARASFTSGELLQVMLTGLAGRLALHGLSNAIKDAIASGREREACQAVRWTLTDLNREREAAGLSPVHVPACR